MKRIVVALFTSFQLLAMQSSALASCGSATCPLNTSRFLTAGILSVGLSYEYINQDRIYVGSSRSFIGALPNPHDEVRTINKRTLLQLHYGITDAISANVELPFIQREHTHIENGMMENFSFNGIGDLIVNGQYAVLLPSNGSERYLGIVVGLKLPLGATHVMTPSGDHVEVTLLPGTGSLDGILGISYRQTLFDVPGISGLYSTVPLTVRATYQMNGRGEDNYRIGNIFMAHVGTEYQFVQQASLLLQLNARFQGKADVGSTGEFPQNTGGTYFFVSPGLSVHVLNNVSPYFYVQIPVYQNVNGIQQTAPYNLQVGVTADINVLP